MADQIIEAIQKVQEKILAGAFGDAFVSALNAANGLMQERIFTKNEDTDGNDFGKYIGKKRIATGREQLRLLFGTESELTKKRIRESAFLELTSYQRKRAARGRQVSKKDLELEGALRRSIETVVLDERSAAIQFNTDKFALIARGQENQITNIREGKPGTTKGDGVKIFALDDNERGQANEIVQALVLEIFTT